MSITIKDSADVAITLTKREIRVIFKALDDAYSEIEAAVADGDVKEEIQDQMEDALRILKGLNL